MVHRVVDKMLRLCPYYSYFCDDFYELSKEILFELRIITHDWQLTFQGQYGINIHVNTIVPEQDSDDGMTSENKSKKLTDNVVEQWIVAETSVRTIVSE